MQICTSDTISRGSTVPADLPSVLGTSILLDLEAFPELTWIRDYLRTLSALQQEHDQLTQAIQSVTEEGEVYRDCWIEPYTKTKNGKHYTYHQLRWLTGDRKKSGQPKVKTKHLSHRAVGEVRAAIERGHQVEALEKQRQQVEAEIFRLREIVLGTSKKIR